MGVASKRRSRKTSQCCDTDRQKGDNESLYQLTIKTGKRSLLWNNRLFNKKLLSKLKIGAWHLCLAEESARVHGRPQFLSYPPPVLSFFPLFGGSYFLDFLQRIQKFMNRWGLLIAFRPSFQPSFRSFGASFFRTWNKLHLRLCSGEWSKLCRSRISRCHFRLYRAFRSGL